MNKITCFKSSNRLKGSGISFSEDVSKAAMDILSENFDTLEQESEDSIYIVMTVFQTNVIDSGEID